MRLWALGVALFALLPGLSLANDFPTQARVEFVLGCMNENGGQSYDTLYPCVCLIDRIAASMTYAEFAKGKGSGPHSLDSAAADVRWNLRAAGRGVATESEAESE